ncbi:MAG: hypothetical protein A2X82_00645 [Geobacteraceae bacterium GWC2_55_20]|nr:MAG: hypothetical protein A2X82_00645 [Geobacteraceae bacterium GWC2_55_20]OGU18779.1 MAG: hypothetical protein A2X85_08915 [Geobacteraceae bacterium GWF2_54_21]HBA71209.1 hypothetical protein [Geobacter sp.]
MIIYHPAYDIAHCAYRFFLLFENIKVDELSYEKFRVLDFYLLFPNLLKAVILPQEIRIAKKAFNNIPEPYETIPNPSRLMFELSNIQDACIASLVARGMLDKDAFNSASIKRTQTETPKTIKEKINSDPTTKQPWFIYLVNELISIDFNGPKGLKARSNLMEYRYDKI